jgi:rhamnose utilization protein RhaD (predicted bifunctional aldolase and dehydrogenase)
MIHWVTVAEDYVAKNGKRRLIHSGGCRRHVAAPSDIAPMLRGAVAARYGEGRISTAWCRTSAPRRKSLNSSAAPTLQRLAARGVSTPDLSIRIKTGPVVLPAPAAGDASGYRAAVEKAVGDYVKDYTRYFVENDARDDIKRTMLDPMPRLSLVPGLGMFGHGRTLKDARIASDVGEMWIEAVSGAEADRRLPSARQIGSVRTRILVAGTGKAGRQQAEAADRAGGADHRRRRRDWRGDSETVRRQRGACRGGRSRRRQGCRCGEGCRQ